MLTIFEFPKLAGATYLAQGCDNQMMVKKVYILHYLLYGRIWQSYIGNMRFLKQVIHIRVVLTWHRKFALACKWNQMCYLKGNERQFHRIMSQVLHFPE